MPVFFLTGEGFLYAIHNKLDMTKYVVVVTFNLRDPSDDIGIAIHVLHCFKEGGNGGLVERGSEGIFVALLRTGGAFLPELVSWLKGFIKWYPTSKTLGKRALN